MILRRLTLHNFRTYGDLDISFDEGLTIIEGSNAVGKSNLAEAIQFLSLARSWRTNEEAILIKEGESEASIVARVTEGRLTREIEIEFSKAGKKIRINGKPIRKISELSKVVNVICFSPEDVLLFSSSPGERRNFLDVSLCKQSQDYFNLISTYHRLLKERNALLKSPQVDMPLLEVITEQLIDVCEPIVRYRTMYVASLNTVLPEVLQKIRGVESRAELVYKACARDDGTFREKIRAAFSDALKGDLMRKTTSVGPHRDDLVFKLDGKDISDYGSQGENRMAVLALKLAPSFLIENEDKKPICVLDDVTSELDAEHVKDLSELLKSFPQVFVTTTHLTLDGASYVDVSANTAIRRK